MKAPLRLFRSFSLRHLGRRKLRFFLAGISIILAVALFVSMRITEESILNSFSGSVEALSGKADLQVTRGDGVEASALATIEKIPGLRAAPIIQATTMIPSLGARVLVLGIDFPRDARLREYDFEEQTVSFDPASLFLFPTSVVISGSFANRFDLKMGSTLDLDTPSGRQTFRIAGILSDTGAARVLGGNIVVLGIGAAQTYFGQKDRYDRIEVALEEATQSQIENALGVEYSVFPLTRTNPVLDFLLAQQRLALSAVTVVAMLIGIFIIYNTFSLSVVERVKEIGILRALGARRSEVIGALLLEAGFIGLAASGLGVLLGLFLSRFFIQQAATQINLLVYLVDVSEVTLPLDAVVFSLAVGLFTAMAGSLVPALSASRVSPMVAIRKAVYGKGLSGKYWKGFLLGLLFFGGSVFLSTDRDSTLNLMMLSLVLAFVGLAFMLPQMILWVGSLFRFVARRTLSVEGFMAFDNVVKFPSRTALTVIAFAGSLSIVVVLWGILTSFEHSVDRWLHSIFPFDYTVQLQDLTVGAYGTGTFPESAIENVRSDPRVSEAYAVRTRFIPFRDETVMLIAFETAIFERLQKARGLPEDPGLSFWIREGVPKGEISISTNFANLHGVNPGEEITLSTPQGNQNFRISSSLVDFSWPRGVVVFDLAEYQKIWGDQRLTYIDVAAKEGGDREALRTALGEIFKGRFDVFIYDTEEIRTNSLGLVRDWFRLADAQIVIALLIGAIGVINTLLISVLTQKRQVALLRAIGATMKQIAVTLTLEALFLGVISGILGCAIGIFVVKFPIAIMMMLESGFEIPFVLPTKGVLVALGGGVIIALVSSLAPVRLTRKIDIVDAIGYE
ncbi:MAG: FtsX-like permease family protein [Planctomycetota bacterium]|nr:FtsX-like permease family protein [Planctomycetota bacterium]